MKHSRRSLLLVRGLMAITLTALASALFAAGSAAMARGVITGTGQEHTVTSKNQTLKGVFAGITVAVDNAHVNLSGATVDCSLGNTNFGIGIHLTNRSGVHINGGTVKNCNVGVLLGDPFANANGGSNNHINGVAVRDAIAGGGTSFDGDGIVINNGSNNRANNNEITNVGGAFLSAGMRLWNGGGNDVIGNTINGLQAGGIGAAGLLLQGADATKAHGNFAFSRPDGVGIWAQLGALDNFLTGNRALGNGTDLQDDNANCDNNTWRGNTFGSSNAACIQ